jgi:CubicO group peptidase (beta-lactamase class C family)
MPLRLGLAAALVLTPAAAQLAEPTADAPLESLRLLPPVLVTGDAGWTLAERMRHHRVEGVGVALIRDYQIAWEATAGLADREQGRKSTLETLFQAGSISKPVAAAMLLREVQKGRFRLDADVSTYLRSWKLPANELTAREKVTLERILSHGAGLTVHGFPGYAAGQPIPSVPQVLDGAPPANTAPVRVDLLPGSRWRYSGGGYTVAQLAMTDTLGRPFPELARSLWLDPSGMSRSSYAQPLPPERLAWAAAGYRRDGSPVVGKRHLYPEMAAAGLWTTAGDLARFAIAIQRSLRGKKGALLTQPIAERMVTPFIGDHGLGFGIDRPQSGESYFGHGGADEGFQALLQAHRGGWGAVVMTNSDNGIALAVEIVRGLARQEGWRGFLPEPVTPVALSGEERQALTGRYRLNGDEVVTVELAQDHLLGRSEGAEFELVATPNEVLVRRDRPTSYRVLRADGAVRALSVETGASRVEAVRLRADETIPFDHVAAGRFEEAAAAYLGLFAQSPSDPGVAEARLNRLGYQLAGSGRRDQAIAVLRINTQLYPDSANTWDSLGEVLLQDGQRERALECYRKLLEVLPLNHRAEAATLSQLRTNAERQIRELSR